MTEQAPKKRDEAKDRRNADHLWHVWINRRQDENRKVGGQWEGSLYEFKDMLQFLESGHKVIADAFEGKLPKVHRQCSRQAPVEIKDNILKCACQGQDVTTCPILLSLKSVFDGEKNYDVPVDNLYRTMAKTCAWHTYKIAEGIEEKGLIVDTSEGYLMDEGDRMFWSNVYESLSDEPEQP